MSPGAKWLRDPEINAWIKEVLSSSYYSGLDSLFDWEELQELLVEHENKTAYNLYPLWNVIALQVWARAHKVTTD